jgi:hypothetical protein
MLSFNKENRMSDELPKNATLLIDGLNGQYVPRCFAKMYDLEEWNVRPEDAAILMAGPDHAEYWDTWDHVLQHAWHENNMGVKYCLYQDGDLWSYCPEEQDENE